MKKNILLCLFVILLLPVYSQCYLCCGRINCVIFVDGKIPNYSMGGNIEYRDSTNGVHVVNFSYNIGEIIFSEEDIKILQSLPTNTPIKINLKYTEFKRGAPKRKYNYFIKDFGLPMLLESGFVIFNITNLNKRKKTYNFGFYTDTLSRIPHKKEPKILQSTW